ncbi:Myb-like DNA-binding domain containing protein [Tritrichomonas foetus]|uniref:Myb-like DNA-binding domain containing protein n=1 Tax=Tritrichomonas foetus TaxID=1144522 RepID=A0A1J4K0E7_9EUKA|nr:Myb-like DNA-binding domain containing protein [Tritrichomonas foetus]|eukprot:OHT04889.1 Myb-like DNA-binding domain containing protein [Tritrichomonas foetus]
MNTFKLHLMKPKKSRKAFSTSEDVLLKELVNTHGESNWSLISNLFPDRNSRQCRDRWRSYLRPTIMKSQWTKEEDLLLMEKYDEFGPKWSVIGKFLIGRSDIAMKNRWKILANVPSENQHRNLLVEKLDFFNSFSLIKSNTVPFYSPFTSAKSHNDINIMPCIIHNNTNTLISNLPTNSSYHVNNYNLNDLSSRKSEIQSNESFESSADTSAVQEKIASTPQELEVFFTSISKFSSFRTVPKLKL